MLATNLSSYLKFFLGFSFYSKKLPSYDWKKAINIVRLFCCFFFFWQLWCQHIIHSHCIQTYHWPVFKTVLPHALKSIGTAVLRAYFKILEWYNWHDTKQPGTSHRIKRGTMKLQINPGGKDLTVLSAAVVMSIDLLLLNSIEFIIHEWKSFSLEQGET